MKKLYFLVLFSFFTLASFGQVVSEDFNYADNALLTASGWVAHSGAATQPVDVGASNGLTYAGYSGTTGLTGAIVGNAARLDNTGEDINKVFTPAVTSGSLYFSFLVNVTAAEAGGGYFTHFGPGGTSTSGFVTKVFVKTSVNAGKINFGASNTNTGVYATTDYDLNTTYLIIVKYDVSTTGAISMWIKSTGVPATEAAAGTPDVTTSGTGSASIGGVYLRQYNAAQNITVDGIRVYSSWFGTTPCALSLAAETTVCDAVTFNTDTYTTTIPFTGGNTGTYTLSTTSGTISGDNPSTTATGNIIVSGVPEGTGFTLTVAGTCGFTKIVASPECKPVNALPFIDPFLYTAGTALGSYQTWANANTGDDIMAVADNLSYPGFTSYGNAVSFTGAGKECHAPFTATTATDNNLLVSFLVKVTDLSNVTANETYFAGITNGTAAVYRGRIFLKKNGTQYQLGLAYNNSTTATNYHPTLFNVGDVVLVVFGYHFATNTLAAWINPDLATFTITTPPSLVDIPTPTPTDSTIGGFILRQDSDIATPAMVIDELKVASNVTTFLGANQNTISGLTLYPNPVKNGILFIETTLNSPKKVAIYDLLGKEVLYTTTSSNAVNVHTLSKGLYIAKITEEGKTAAVKIAVE